MLKGCDCKKNYWETTTFTEETALQGSRQANPTRPLALWPPHYRMRRLLQNQKHAATEEKIVPGTQPPDY